MARAALRRAAASAVLAVLAAAAPGWSASAGAAGSVQTTARLSLTGLVSDSSPLGGAVMWVHPGDTVEFRAGTVFPVDGLSLGGLLGYHVVLDASGLPGGANPVPLDTSSSYALTFGNAGVYSLTWRAASLFGPLALDVNQLRSFGFSANASMQWRGQIVVTTSDSHPAASLALPQVSVHPNLLAVGQLPEVIVPPVVLNEPPLTPGPRRGGGSEGPGARRGGPPPDGALANTPVTAAVGPADGLSIAFEATPTVRGSIGTSGSQSPPSSHTPTLAAPFPPSSLDTYALDAVLGFLILGGMWILWVVSVRPILGR